MNSIENYTFQIFSKLINHIKNFAGRSNLTRQIISKNLLLNLLYYIASKNLRKKSSKCRTLKELVELVFTYRYSISRFTPPKISIASLQIKSELYRFCKKIFSLKPRVILEIGTANGGTLFLLSKLSCPDSIIISVDLQKNLYTGGIDYKPKFFLKSFAHNNQKIVIIRKDSHKFSTLEKVKKVLNNKSIDILFLDGDHTYNGVKKDFNMYGNLVRQNGIIAFHDIVEVTIEEGVEVNKFWNELKEEYNYIEIVEDWNQDNCGIGIIINE